MYVFVGGQENPNGISSYVNNIGRQLVLQGNKVTVFLFGSCNKKFELDGMAMIQRKAPHNTMIAIPYISFCSIPFIIKYRKDIKIVNFQTTFLAFISGWICRLFGVKVCYTLHSFGDHNHKHGFIVRQFMRVISKLSVVLCQRNFITISESKNREFESRNGKSCYIIPCGVNRPVNFDESDFLERYGINKNRYFLIICRIDPIKNLDTLIRAFIMHKNNGFQLVIGGNYNNDYGRGLRELIGENKFIKLVGTVSGVDKETLLKNCYCNCLVSSSEGMPISLLEGMAYAKPCIVTDIPAIREIVTDEQGCWCGVKDLKGLIKQIEFAENNEDILRSRGLSMAECAFSKYTWNTIANQYVELCKVLK